MGELKTSNLKPQIPTPDTRHPTPYSEFATIYTNAAEIESIVRRVLATLTGETSSLCNSTEQSTLPSNTTKASATLSLLDPVVSLQSLQDRIRGMHVLEIGKAAVITPAARDYCRELRVEVVRGGSTKSQITTSQITTDSKTKSRLQRLLVVGTPAWMPAIAKQLCNQQALVTETAKDDSSVLRTIADGLRSGHQAGVAVVQSPHAVCWQAARDERLRPAVVSNWPELNDVLQQVPANLLILSSKTWNVPSVCNSARRFFQHLQNQS